LDVGQYGGYSETIDLSIGPLPAGTRDIEIRTISNESGVTSNVFCGSTQFPTATVQPGVNGFAWSDVNANGNWDAYEPGLENVSVSLLDQTGQIVPQVYGIEPDDYDHRELLNTVIPEVTLTAVGSGVGSDAVHAWDAGGGATGSNVFAHRLGNGYWNATWKAETRRLRMDFAEPVKSVSLDAISSFSRAIGRLLIFDANDEVIGTYITRDLAEGEIETMTLSRPVEDIAYAIADGYKGWSVRFDNLRFSIDATAQTNRFGAFSFANIEAGSYCRYRHAPAWNRADLAQHESTLCVDQCGTNSFRRRFRLRHTRIDFDGQPIAGLRECRSQRSHGNGSTNERVESREPARCNPLQQRYDGIVRTGDSNHSS